MLQINPKQVRLFRTVLGWTQGDLGDRIGHQQAWVSAVERDKIRIGIDDPPARALADALGVPLSALCPAGTAKRLAEIFPEFAANARTDKGTTL